MVHTFDIDAINAERISWGIFRDRRREMYSAINSADGENRSVFV
ncbi:hypothetical protein [Photobacterium kishitanii]|nr:hypothetical protein [Photobacterium kishitanii]